MKTVVRKDAENEQLCRIYVKGAPEAVLSLCTQTLSLNVQPVEFSERERIETLGVIQN